MAYRLQSIIERRQGKARQGPKSVTWRQKLKPRAQRSAAHELAPCGLLSLLFYTTPDHLPKGGTGELGLPHQSIANQDNPLRQADKDSVKEAMP